MLPRTLTKITLSETFPNVSPRAPTTVTAAWGDSHWWTNGAQTSAGPALGVYLVWPNVRKLMRLSSETASIQLKALTHPPRPMHHYRVGDSAHLSSGLPAEGD